MLGELGAVPAVVLAVVLDLRAPRRPVQEPPALLGAPGARWSSAATLLRLSSVVADVLLKRRRTETRRVKSSLMSRPDGWTRRWQVGRRRRLCWLIPSTMPPPGRTPAHAPAPSCRSRHAARPVAARSRARARCLATPGGLRRRSSCRSRHPDASRSSLARLSRSSRRPCRRRSRHPCNRRCRNRRCRRRRPRCS